MSIVTEYTSADAEAALRRQRKSSTIWSILISFLTLLLIGLLLFLFMIPGWFVETKTIITYAAPLAEEDSMDKPEITPQVQRKPAAPSSATARVIASAAPSSVSIPVPDTFVTEASTEFGSGNDFGEGWGSGSGDGSAGGGTTFFGQTSKGNRICYVIDYSGSMNADGREELMRKELTKSLSALPDGTQYQLIFFAGPAWVAGSKIPDTGARKASVVLGLDGKKYHWTAKGAHDWKVKGALPKAEWITASRGTINDSKKLVKQTKLVWGTQWSHPLEMALAMSPPPQVIYFMTDGSAGNKSAETARKIGAKAKVLDITINCVAMMEPKAFDAMDDLAKRTKGHFTKVMARGKVEKVR